jgi:hypothetical protein
MRDARILLKKIKLKMKIEETLKFTSNFIKFVKRGS